MFSFLTYAQTEIWFRANKIASAFTGPDPGWL